ncbi:ABC transporter permease [Mesorhizobium sp. CN2-181]|uniref:ABC transporter permease n=1 Tax=Mesorhizobium yinganensis TaxID=3157707 RepID=UPI0032B7BAFE
MHWVTLVTNRLIWLAPTLFGILAFVFVLSRVVPVDPAVLAAGENASPAQVEELRQHSGFDEPLPRQFIRYIADVARGDLGTSFYTQQPIADDLLTRLPATLELSITAVLLAALIGIPLGVLAGLRRNSWLDHFLRMATVSCMALASFWIAIQLQLMFSMSFSWLPLSGRTDGFAPTALTGFMVVDALIRGDGGSVLSALEHLVLPALTLALPAAATVQRFTRNSVINVIASPSVTYQSAMGLPRRVIVWKYVLRMALAATVTQLGLIFGILLTGALVVETVFDWPGLGGYAVRSIMYSDYNAVMGLTLCVGALFAVLNLLVDILQAAIDPRGAA